MSRRVHKPSIRPSRAQFSRGVLRPLRRPARELASARHRDWPAPIPDTDLRTYSNRAYCRDAFVRPGRRPFEALDEKMSKRCLPPLFRHPRPLVDVGRANDDQVLHFRDIAVEVLQPARNRCADTLVHDAGSVAASRIKTFGRVGSRSFSRLRTSVMVSRCDGLGYEASVGTSQR